MAAFVLTGHGDLDNLEYHEDWPVPAPGPNQVLIKLHACGLNNTDINTRSGWYSKKVSDATTGGADGQNNGVQAIFLVCAAWSLEPPVQFGDLIVPAFSVGPDGTSIHYGNTSGYVSADPAVVEALAAACRERGATVHVGGNATCEALYRITTEMTEEFRRRGCLCMDNGEASTLFALARTLNIRGGVLFQPYVELAQGWNPAWLRDERYRDACRLQAEIVLEASTRLRQLPG